MFRNLEILINSLILSLVVVRVRLTEEGDTSKLSQVLHREDKERKLTNDRTAIDQTNITIDHPIIHEFVSDRPSDLQRRRLQLYPQWFAKRIPQLLGKSFARRYFYPYGKSHSGAGRNKIQKVTDKEGIRRELLALAKSLHGEEPEYHVPGMRKQAEYLPLSQALARYPTSPIEKVEAPNIELLPEMSVPVRQPTSPYMNDAAFGYQLMPQYGVPNIYQPVQPPVLQYPSAEDMNDNGKFNEDWLSYMKNAHSLAHHHPCHHNPCLNDGHCHIFKHDHSKFACKCKTGFNGRYCQIIQATCHPNPCFHGGTCTKIEHGYFCSCESDYKGTNCQLEAICFKNPCQNGGTCTELEDGYYCTCPKEWNGKDCMDKVSPCQSNPCKNSGTCILKDESYICKCTPGFACDDCSCPVTINQTSIAVSTSLAPSAHLKPCPNGFCKNGGTCFSSKDGPICTCPLAFRGFDCSAPNLCTPSPCDNGGICLQDGDENYKCICPYGFKGPNCGDQLSCMSHPCLNGGKCHESATSFRCECASGFKGKSCDQLSPCSKTPCQHSLSCIEKGPLFSCQCAEGYRGKDCRERDPCTPNPCLNGLCHDVEGIKACNCTVGWIGDFCEIRDECHPNKCQNGGMCVHNGGHFHCVCSEGFYGSHCQYPSPCLSNPCGHNGACHITDYGYICICHEGYRGKQCQVRNKCHPNPCLNEGFCYEGDEDFICECPSGYTGRTCHIQDFCDPNPCRNGGSCFEKIGSFSCSCLSGFVGQRCEADVCLPNPCKNSGTCVPSLTSHGYACECVFPYHGHNCEDSDPCEPNPCKNGGTCKTHLQEFSSSHTGLLNQEVHNDGDHVITIVQPEGVRVTESQSHTIHSEDIDDDGEGEHGISHEPIQLAMHKDDDSNSFHDDQPHSSHVIEFHHDTHAAEEPEHGAWAKEVEHFSSVHDINHSHDPPDWYYHDNLISKDDNDADNAQGRGEIPSSLRSSDDKAVKEFEHNLLNAVIQDSRRHSITKRTKLGYHSNPKETSTGSKRSSLFSNKEPSRKRKPLSRGQLVKRNQLARRTLQDLYVCHCPAGFLGAHCQHPNFCQTAPCKNGGTCLPRGTRYQCRCPAGFGGLNCDDFQPCQPNPCQNKGRCFLSHNIRGYFCECIRGYTGFICAEIDHCAAKNPCLHSSKCVSTQHGVECKCRQRYTGPFCGVDRCKDCSVNATCRKGHCVCNNGFIGNGFRCQMIGNPCQPNPCESGGVCSVGEDGNIFICTCKAGYKGARCESANPCISTPCLHNGVCVDSLNSKSKGIILVDPHEYKCFCPQGYRGKNCEETTLGACSSAPCQNNATCFDVYDDNYGKKKFRHPDEYDCFCFKGYSGRNCEIPSYACHSHPCQNGGSCLDEELLPDVSFDSHGYKCYCRKGFFGKNCEVNIAYGLPCHSSPCLNRGRCVDVGNNDDPDLIFEDSGDFKCFCPATFSGVKCELTFPACSINPCHHNGTCIDGTTHPDMNFDETGYHCLCGSGYEGKNCERQYAFASHEEEAMLHNNDQSDSDEDSQIPVYIADSSSIGDGTAEALTDDVTGPVHLTHVSTHDQGKPEDNKKVISITHDSEESNSIATMYDDKTKLKAKTTVKPTELSSSTSSVISLSTDDGKPGGAAQVLEKLVSTGIKQTQNAKEGTITPIYVFSVNNGKILDSGHKIAEIAKSDQGVSTIVHIKPDTGVPGGAAAIVDQVAKSLDLTKVGGGSTIFSVYPDSKIKKVGQVSVNPTLPPTRKHTTHRHTTKRPLTTKPNITPELASIVGAKTGKTIHKASPTKRPINKVKAVTSKVGPSPTKKVQAVTKQVTVAQTKGRKTPTPGGKKVLPLPLTNPGPDSERAVMEYNTAAKQAVDSTKNLLTAVEFPRVNALPGPLSLDAQTLNKIENSVLNNFQGSPSQLSSMPLQLPSNAGYLQPKEGTKVESLPAVGSKAITRISIPNPVVTNQFGQVIGLPALQPRYYYSSPQTGKRNKVS